MEKRLAFELDPNDDRRLNYRITKCCGSCKFYWYLKNKITRGNCAHPDLMPKNWPNPLKYRKRGRPKVRVYTVEDRDKLVKTHYCCVCDLHQFQGTIATLNRITRYCGARRNADLEL